MVPLPYDSDDSILSYFNIHTSEDEDEESEDEAEDGESLDGADEVETDETSGDEDESDETEEEERPSRYVYAAGFNGVPGGEFSLSYEVYDDLYSNRETL